jgi:hypothetical protein
MVGGGVVIDCEIFARILDWLDAEKSIKPCSETRRVAHRLRQVEDAVATEDRVGYPERSPRCARPPLSWQY